MIEILIAIILLPFAVLALVCAGAAFVGVVRGIRKTKNVYEIYCGDEDRAEFLEDALRQLNVKAECEIFTIDGEYQLRVLKESK